MGPRAGGFVPQALWVAGKSLRNAPVHRVGQWAGTGARKQETHASSSCRSSRAEPGLRHPQHRLLHQRRTLRSGEGPAYRELRGRAPGAQRRALRVHRDHRDARPTAPPAAGGDRRSSSASSTAATGAEPAGSAARSSPAGSSASSGPATTRCSSASPAPPDGDFSEKSTQHLTAFCRELLRAPDPGGSRRAGSTRAELRSRHMNAWHFTWSSVGRANLFPTIHIVRGCVRAPRSGRRLGSPALQSRR